MTGTDTGRPIAVGMNLLWLRPGVVGGSEVSAVGTVRALHDHAAEDVALSLYAQASFPAAHPDVAATVTTSTVAVPAASLALRVGIESSWLSWRMRRDHVDVAHYYGGVIPPGARSGAVLTIHDVQPLESGSAFAPTKRRWLTRMIPSSVARAGSVAVPSRFVRDRLVDLVDVDPDKVTVVPHGIDPPVDPSGDADDAGASIRRRFRLPGPFAVYPAITYTHKNHATLLEAFARVAPRISGATLVLAGGPGDVESEVIRRIEGLGIGDRVRRVGRIPGRELDALLREASVMAFPSRYEGFGLPVLEALSRDTPVVASNAGALPEVLGDAGTLVDPDDVDGWVAALSATLEGSGRTADAADKRRERVRRFTWEHTADLLVELYRRAARDPEVMG